MEWFGLAHFLQQSIRLPSPKHGESGADCSQHRTPPGPYSITSPGVIRSTEPVACRISIQIVKMVRLYRNRPPDLASLL